MFSKNYGKVEISILALFVFSMFFSLIIPTGTIFASEAVTPQCETDINIVSDTSDMIVGNGNAVATYSQNPRWTASIPGATWIWKTFYVSDPLVDDETSFTKNFDIPSDSTVVSASLIMAADNSYTVSMNGTQVGADATEFNYFDENKDTYDTASFLHGGSNTISFTVKNWALADSTVETNPAGLLYKLTIHTHKTSCDEKPPTSININIAASKIVCDSESDLPNWGLGGPDITAGTASEFLNTHPNCHLAPDWKFQWASSTESDPGANFIGEASGWNIFGPTDQQGIVTTAVSVSSTTPYVWVREVLKNNYLPFTYPGDNSSSSAEMYCHTDVLNYDNYDRVDGPFVSGNTYYCAAFNVAKKIDPTNTPPTITLIGANPFNLTVNTTFTDPGATATDLEDGDATTTSHIIVSGSVATSTVGTYTLTYSVTDSGGLSTSTTRTVNVNPVVCVDNCGPTNTPPTITLIGANPLNITVDTVFVDPGATATDLEDGNATTTSHIIVTGTVNASTTGTYTLTYSVTDSGGLGATTTRTVNVNPIVTPPVNPPSGGGGGIGGHRHPVVVGEILGATSCSYLRDHLKIDWNNDPIEVLKLQSFLNVFEKENLPLTGVFNQATFEAVQRFQIKYSGDVLQPWGDNVTTGFVYILTKKKINEIYCNTVLPVTQNEQSEIDAFNSSSFGVGGDSSGAISGVTSNQGGSNIGSGSNTSSDISGINVLEDSPVVELKDGSTTPSILRNAAISLFALPQKIFGSWKYFLAFIILIIILITIIKSLFGSDDDSDNGSATFVEEETPIKEPSTNEDSPVIILPGVNKDEKDTFEILPNEEIVVENPEEDLEETILENEEKKTS